MEIYVKCIPNSYEFTIEATLFDTITMPFGLITT